MKSDPDHGGMAAVYQRVDLTLLDQRVIGIRYVHINRDNHLVFHKRSRRHLSTGRLLHAERHHCRAVTFREIANRPDQPRSGPSHLAAHLNACILPYRQAVLPAACPLSHNYVA